jgi:hypothetical protein
MESRTKKPRVYSAKVVVVRGAGNEAFNGEYLLDRTAGSDEDGPPEYTIEGSATTIDMGPQILYQGPNGPNKIFYWAQFEHWAMGFRCYDGMGSRWTACYKTDIMQLKATNSMPPARGWWDVEYEGKAGEMTSPPIVLSEGIHPLDWRDAANSDDGLDRWTIQIVDEETSLVTEYSAHPYVLANATDYFKSLFSKDFAEKKERTSRIIVPSDVGRVFSYFLDHIYKYHGNPTNMQPPWAFICPLYWLGSYFGTAYLLDDLMRFLDSRMSDNPTWCYKLDKLVASAQRNNIHPILEASAAACAKMILRLRGATYYWSVIAVIDPSFWATVFPHLSSEPSDGQSEQASLILADVCAAATALDPALFSTLTSMLPYIDPSAAYRLLQKESELTNQYVGVSQLTHFQTKCIAAFAYKKLDTNRPELLSQPVMFFLELVRLTQG